MRNVIVMGAFGLGFLALQRVLTHHPVFSGYVAERTDLIAWNLTLMDCIQQLTELVSDDEMKDILERLEQVRTASLSRERSSLRTLQHSIASTTAQIVRVVGRPRATMTMEQMRIQNTVMEDVVEVIESILQNVQHNHMLDTLGP
jgi:hypothetical protein